MTKHAPSSSTTRWASSSASRASRRASRTPTTSSTTTTGDYVLTLFEHIPRADLPFYVGLMDHLAHHEITCPAPMRRDDGEMLTEVNGKPAVIVTKLPGAPRAQHHGRGIAASRARCSPRSTWRASSTTPRSTTGAARSGASASRRSSRPASRAAENALIASENRYQAMHDDTVLPQGIIHGDYFHDNVLWDDEGHPGVIDFYFACDDVLAYDLAIAANDWCVERRRDARPGARGRAARGLRGAPPAGGPRARASGP